MNNTQTAVGRCEPTLGFAREYTYIDNLEALRAVWPKLIQGCEPIALDLETYGDYRGNALDPYLGEIRLLSVALPQQAPVLFDLRALGYGTADWSELVREREVIAHHARFDAAWLLHKLGIRLPKVFCTYSASKVLSNGDVALSNDLGAVLERFLDLHVAKELGSSDWGGFFLLSSQLQYAATDVVHLHALREVLTENLKAQDLWKVFRLEMRLLPTVADMQNHGIPVCRPTLRSILDEVSVRKKSYEPELKRYLGRWKNFASYDQVLEAFAEIGVALEDTAEQTLKPCNHPAARLLLDYRKADMERKQAESLIKSVRPNGRIHSEFKPLGPETGRFASKSPNLQNVKNGRLREAFAPIDPDRAWVVCDYSQIELRVSSWLAEDRAMMQAFLEGKDLHNLTAAAVLGKPEGAVTKADRKLAKGLNFGLVYGQRARGFVRYMRNKFDILLSEDEAQDYIDAFFGLYTGLARWHREAWAAAASVTEGRTILGRRRLIPDDAPDWKRFQAQVNFVVQGGCADGLKVAMVNLAAKLPTGARLIGTVHDELLLECPRAIAGEVLELTKGTMTDAFTRLFPGLPVQVDGAVCNHWGEK
jgi:DNA polymerase I